MAKRTFAFAAAFAALLSFALSVQAENYDYYWKGGSGNYFTQSMWQLSDGSAAPVPLSSTTNVITAYIDASGSSVNFDYSHLGDGVKSLTIGGGSGAVSVTRYSGNTLTIAPNKFISVLSNGTLTVQNTMFINADGLMSVNGGSLSTTGIEISGTFSYTSGNNFVNANTINLYDGGTLNLAGSGQFRINGASAVLNIQGGNATVDNISYIGVGENGVINQTGGTATFNNTLAFGWGSGDGTYNLSGGTLTTTADVGLWCSKSSGFNTFNMTGGTANFNQTGNSFTIGLYQTFTPAQVANVFNLNSGTVNAADTFAIQYGGTLKVSKDGDNGGNGVLNAKAITLTNTGNLNMSSGTINVGEGGIASSDGAYTVTLSGGTFGTNGSNWSSGLNATISSDAVTFSPDEGKSITWSGVLSGAGGVTKAGAGTLELTGVNTYTGKTTVSEGTLKLSGSGKLASSVIDVETGSTLTYYNTTPQNTSPLTFNVNGGTLEFYNDRTTSVTHADNNAICTGAANADVTIYGTGGTLLIDGGGHVGVLNGKNSTVTISMDKNSTIYVKDGYFMNGGYTMQNWSNNQAELKIGSTGIVNLWDGQQMKVGGLIGDAGAQMIDTQSSGKGISVGNGVTSDQSFTYNGTIDMGKKVFDYVGAGTQVLNGDISNVVMTSKSGTLALGTANNQITLGAGARIISNGGTVRVDGNININSEFVTVKGAWTGNGSITVSSGGELRAETNFSFDKGITLSGGTLRNATDGRTVTVSAPLNLVSESYFKSGWEKNMTLTGSITGAGKFHVKTDSGYVIAATTCTDNSFTGSIHTDNESGSYGLLRLGANNPFGTNAGEARIWGTLDMNGYSQTFAGVANSADTTAGKVKGTISSVLTLKLNSNASKVYGGSFEGALSLVLTGDGSGTQIFKKAPAYTGSTTVQAGTLQLDAGGTLYNLSGGSLDSNGQIAVAATLDASGKALTLSNDQMTKFIGSIKADSIVKTGDGTLQIYTAAAGQVDASSFVVSSGRLDMKEYFKGSLDVEANATMSPGNSVGKLTVDGTYNLDSGAALLLEVGKDDLGNIVIDQLFVNGNATFESGSIIDIVLDPSSSLVGGDEFSSVIITANNAAIIFDDVKAAIRSYYFTDLTVTRSGNEISLSGRLDPNAVPEPSTWVLMALGAAGLLYWRRKNA